MVRKIKAVKKDKVVKKTKLNKKSFWQIGESYFIRTVTMHHIGKLKEIDGNDLVFEDAVWVADSGRFNNALKTGELSEVEPFVNDVLVNRTAIIDSTIWGHKIPNKVL